MAAIAIWFAAAGGVLGIVRQPIWKPLYGTDLYLAAALWIPLVAATARAPFWMTRWLNRRNHGGLVFRLWDFQGRVQPEGRYLSMEIDPREPIHRETILAGARQICASTAVCASCAVVVLLIGWLILRQPWMFASACAFTALLAWEAYLRRHGMRYHTGLRNREGVVRGFCLQALGTAVQDQTPIQDWHPEYLT